MNNETHGALKRIIEEVKQKRKSTCPMKDCIINDMIGGNDIDIVEEYLNKNTCRICNQREDDDGRCGCTNKDAY